MTASQTKQLAVYVVSFMSVFVLTWKFITSLMEIRTFATRQVQLHKLRVQARSGTTNFGSNIVM